MNMFDLGKAVALGHLSLRSENSCYVNIEGSVTHNHIHHNNYTESESNNKNDKQLVFKFNINIPKKEDEFIVPIIKY